MASSEEVWVVMKVLDWTVRSAKDVKDILKVVLDFVLILFFVDGALKKGVVLLCGDW